MTDPTEPAAGLSPLSGGWSGRTFLADAGAGRSVVRIHPPGERPETPEVDAAVLHLVRGLVPVPRVLEVRRPDAAADVPGLLVTEWIAGLRGDLALPSLDDAGRRRMGRDMGRIAGTLAGMPTPYGGAFGDASLRIAPFPDGGLPEWVAGHPVPGWAPESFEALARLAETAQDRLDGVGRTCLVHSDLNPKNVLVDDGGAVVAVLDWEFAHSGHPHTDLGNVLRFDRDPVYADAALAAYVDLRGGRPQEVLDLARAADLWALVELAARDVRNPVADRAEVLLRGIVSSGDLHAWPEEVRER